MEFINKVINKYLVESDANFNITSVEREETGTGSLRLYYKINLGDLRDILPKLNLPKDFDNDDFTTKLDDLHFSKSIKDFVEKSMIKELENNTDMSDIRVEVDMMESIRSVEELKDVKFGFDVVVTFEPPDRLQNLTTSALQLALKNAWDY